jgi:RNA-binding protein YlmH
VLARCVASTKAFTLMARAERRRLFLRLAWYCDDNDDAQLDRIEISYHEAKRAMRTLTTLTLYTTRPRAT